MALAALADTTSDMPTVDTLRSELARLRVQHKEVAKAIGTDKSTMSLVLSGRRARPDLVEKAWRFVQKKKERSKGK